MSLRAQPDRALRAVGTRRRAWAHILLATVFLAAGAGAAANEVQGMRVHQAPDHTRVVLDTVSPLDYHVFALDNPHRVVIDLRDATAGAGFSVAGLASLSSRFSEIRSAARGSDYRIVIESAAVLKPRPFLLKPAHPRGHRLVVDLYDDDAERKRPPVIRERPDGQRDVLIAIDAGHGGEDPGALGPSDGNGRRVQEKRVVLEIAKRIKRRFDAATGYSAMLVREGDYYVALRRRMQLAREARADLFISIHADAFKSPDVRGVSVYTLSERGASSETASWLAQRENRSDMIGGVDGDYVRLDEVDELLASVLLDMAMHSKKTDSALFAQSILDSLRSGPGVKLHKKRVESAAFVVLKSPDVPAVLVETGYISNPGEARRLTQRDYQDQIADAVFNGVRRQMEISPPADSLLRTRQLRAAENGFRRHTISRGETLSSIAVRYGVSQRVLRQHNSLTSDRIRAGQVLEIPAG